MSGTKLAIFCAAIDLFYAKGYAGVGIREIARAVGVKSASLYNHFGSKEDIVEQMYSFFFDSYYDNIPFLEDVLEQVPNLSPAEALDKLLPPCDTPEVYQINTKIAGIALKERFSDQRASALVDGIISRVEKRIVAVLGRYLELDLIEPIDTHLFFSVFISFSSSPSTASSDGHTLPFEDWRDGRRLLYQLIRPK